MAQTQGIAYINEGLARVDVSIRINKKRPRARMLFEREDGESKQAFEVRLIRWAAEWKAQQLNTPKTARTRTVQDLVTDFLTDSLTPNVKKRKKPITESTRARYATDLKSFLAFCESKEVKYIAQLTHDRCNAYFTYMQESGYSTASIRACWKTLRTMFKYERSKRDSALLFDPTSEIDPPADPIELDEVVPYEEREVRIILDIAATEAHRDAIIVLWRSGLRIGELAALPIKHVQFIGSGSQETALVDVRDYRRDDGSWWRPKAKSSRRKVPVVAPDAIAALKRFLARNQDGFYLLGGLKTNTWFTNEFDRIRRVLIAQHPECASRFLALRTSGRRKSYWLSCHTFRKTFACDALNSGGLTLAEVGEILGHSSEYMTRKYARFSDDSVLTLGEKMRRSFALSHAQRDTKRDTKIRNMAKIA